MPHRPPHLCAHPGCGELCRGRARCTEHTREQTRRFDRHRESGSVRYPWDWQKPGGIRERHLRRESQCRECQRSERLQVDHIDGDRTNHHSSNLRTLCHSCHSRRTARDQVPRRRRPRR